jgi:hypothetical protein
VVDQRSAPPQVTDLADAWWQMSRPLRQCRRDFQRLPTVAPQAFFEIPKKRLDSCTEMPLAHALAK